MAGTISRLLGKDQPGVDSCQHCGGKMPKAGTDEHGGDGYRGESDGGGAAMPGRPIANPKGGGPGQKAGGTKKGAAFAPVKDNSSPRAGGPEGDETASGGAGGGVSDEIDGEAGSAAVHMPDDQDIKKPAIKGAGGGSSKRGAKTATETPQADGQTKPSMGGTDDGEDSVWQPKSTWEHGWGSESTPDDSLSGDDGDEPDKLEKKR